MPLVLGLWTIVPLVLGVVVALHLLVELGTRRMVGGQEDMIVDVALDLLNSKA